MELEELRRRTHPMRTKNLALWATIALVLGACWNQTGMSLSALVAGGGNMFEYLRGNPDIADSGFFPPSLSGSMLSKYLWAMLETIEMAVLALALSVAVAFPLSFLASRNTLELIFPGRSMFWRFLRGVLYSGTRLFANLTRSINEIIWALLFVSVVGLGPMPSGIGWTAIPTTASISPSARDASWAPGRNSRWTTSDTAARPAPSWKTWSWTPRAAASGSGRR